MQEQLKENLNQFRVITVALIETLRKESYDELELLFQRRQAVIEAIDKLEYSKDEFKKICDDHQILSLQEELATLLNEKKLAAKAQMANFLNNKNANKSYNNKFSVDSIYFNKKY